MSLDAIRIRPNERAQLLELLPQCVDLYESRNLDERAAELERITEQFNESETEYDIGRDKWTAVIQALDELDSTRAAWLRSKIARRANLSVGLMGFTTSLPVGVVLNDYEQPVRR